ncbi:MAG: hypothetical protein WAV90_22900 [Gordonia amarae]
MLRVSAKNIAAQTDDNPATVRLQLWPVDHSAGLRRIKHYPAVVPRAVGLTSVDMESEWNRLMSARSTAGDFLPRAPTTSWPPDEQTPPLSAPEPHNTNCRP